MAPYVVLWSGQTRLMVDGGVGERDLEAMFVSVPRVTKIRVPTDALL